MCRAVSLECGPVAPSAPRMRSTVCTCRCCRAQVLLPTAFLRITVPATAVRSVRLLEDLALRQGSTLLLAAVPALSLSESRVRHVLGIS